MLKKVWRMISDILLIVLIALVAMLVLPRLFGIQPLVVLSGSMEPTYHVGSLIYVAQVEPTDLETGDSITYIMSDEETKVTHRIIKIDQENQCVYTKGDANNVADGSAVAYASIIGKPLFSIPKMGYLASYFTTDSETIVLITGIAAILILVFMSELISKVDQEEKRNQYLEDRSEHERI